MSVQGRRQPQQPPPHRRHRDPYQLNKTTLLERIAELVREGRIPDISDLRDESDRKGMHVVIELKRGASPRKVLNQLFKYTPLQSTFGVNMLALVEGEPRLLSLKRALQIYVDHRIDVIIRRTNYLLRQARERAHILEGLRIALQFLDEVIHIIRTADSADDARHKLIVRFGLSERQAQAILDMQLRRLALERQKIEDEYQTLLGQIKYYEELLETGTHPRRHQDEVLDLKALCRRAAHDHRAGSRRGSPRRPDPAGGRAHQRVAGQLHQRTPLAAYRAQKRGARAFRACARRTRTRSWTHLRTRSTTCSSSPTAPGLWAAGPLPDAARWPGLPMVNF